MKKLKLTFWSSLGLIIVGASCCWITTLLVWIGGATFVGVGISFVENIQGLLLGIGVVGLITAAILYRKCT